MVEELNARFGADGWSSADRMPLKDYYKAVLSSHAMQGKAVYYRPEATVCVCVFLCVFFAECCLRAHVVRV